jgi:hypothetical protein
LRRGDVRLRQKFAMRRRAFDNGKPWVRSPAPLERRRGASYRIYLINAAKGIIEAHDISCEGDEAALALALPFLPTWPVVEIWDDAGRRVVRLTAPRPGSKYLKINRSFAAPGNKQSREHQDRGV